ncbi:MAG TPA: prepilin-type N-terminal cleavage/methylation domain-containing protein [Stellaceae bacterium]|nr:prepilin-type N-terminal cleavage/methylation domain-containing protein [Stellaceae bacterium]
MTAPSTQRRRTAEAGFTLVELLVAVSLLALLTVVLAGGMTLATKRFTRHPERIDRAQRIAAAQDFLLTTLADARPLLDQDSGAAHIAFAGGPTQLLFLAPAPESTPEGGLMAYGLRFNPPTRGADGRLELGARLFDVPAGASGRTTLLLDHVAKVQLSYYGRVARETRPSWNDEWDAARALPSLARIAVAFSDGTTMPDLVVALRLAGQPPVRR